MTLYEHRNNLKDNPECYTYDVYKTDRLVKTLRIHLKDCGYKGRFERDLLRKIIELIFKSQNEKPFFHIKKASLPMCWNRRQDWDKFYYITYQWGHLKSKNQNSSKAYNIRNLGLHSARCNQHIQSSMDVEELCVYGGVLAERIGQVSKQREKLFASEEWENIEEKLKKYSF